MQLQEINGAKVGPVHRSDKSCAEIIVHIAHEMRKMFVSNVKKAESKISITIDESTVHGRAYMIMYVRCDMTGKGDVDNVFLDLKELAQGTDAESIYNSLREAICDAGFDDKFLINNLISIATDGASVLTGKRSGVITRLKQDFPKMQSIHCLCHRLELAVHDSLKLVAGCNHFEIFVSKLYTLYNQSAKNVRLLKEAAEELNVQLLKIGQIFTIRWVSMSSSFRTVKAVWNDYPALTSHFKVASEDPSRNDTEEEIPWAP
ncbi:E3 SUMO-protein ligase KIAA1586 [Merluccius polli]|uniref:E3 SUMO-protein ligase KIAA1586 n=1 Tax=Merluccius polli TaxID=89951 RepID=A0AA47NXB1_MERPO|nr:E3 SUMO-protein ligase KIAA1586 [Merluccius polli]